MEIKYGRRRMKGSENKMRTKVQIKWTGCHAPLTSSATVMYMDLLSNTRLSSLKKENRREPFAFHPSFKSTFTAPATLPTYGRLVGQLALTAHLSSNHERQQQQLWRKRKKKSFVYTVTNRVMDVSSALHAHQTCAWTPHLDQERLERRRGGRKENGSTTDVSSAT